LAFYACRALKTIRLPIDVDYIGSQAFNECPNLTIFACENSRLFSGSGITVYYNPKFEDIYIYNVRKIKCDKEGNPE